MISPGGGRYRLKVAAEMLQTREAFVTRLTGVRPLASVAAQVTLQIGLPLHCVRTKGAFEAHDGVCKEEDKPLETFISIQTNKKRKRSLLFFLKGETSATSLTSVEVFDNAHDCRQRGVQLLRLLGLLCPRLLDVQLVGLAGASAVRRLPLGRSLNSPPLWSRHTVQGVMRVHQLIHLCLDVVNGAALVGFQGLLV